MHVLITTIDDNNYQRDRRGISISLVRDLLRGTEIGNHNRRRAIGITVKNYASPYVRY